MLKVKIIAVDCDGTLFENKWPELGAPNMELIEYLKAEQKNGNKVILWTCRCGTDLTKAIYECIKHDLYFDAVNENVPEVLKEFGYDCRKIYADEYIDDLSSAHWKLPFVAPVKKQNMIWLKSSAQSNTAFMDSLYEQCIKQVKQEAIVKKLENIFGFELYDWQKTYLFGGNIDFYGILRCGKTFIKSIKNLIIDDGKFDLHRLVDVRYLVDIPNPSLSYVHWLQGYMLDLNEKLVAAGFKTNHVRGYIAKL